MSGKISVYGFGSYFRADISRPKDIDILIVHADLSAESIEAALKCKTFLIGRYRMLDVSVLSASEERNLGFIRGSSATLLCSVDENEIGAIGDHFETSIRLPDRGDQTV
ncbi:hypothetical protein [Bradyrhizobium sp. S69]|uniref:hypothetical protein n=1 Tax=Bradyrhizobium sp. S69 TaxID=1641856 RepID=UPI00131E2F52|nr:hypothetical protein [Bradyrhizobium sp. S69]